MSYPLVSIIVPTYDRTEFLKLTIESIINQTYKNLEIIVIDDGTPNDKNLLLCQTFKEVKYIKIENSGGPAKPRNTGINLAKGKYIAFIDDDDLWLPNKIETQVNILEQNPEFGLIHGCCQVINENGILQSQIAGRPGSIDVKHGNVSMKMMGNWTLMTPSVLLNKSIVDKVGLFNEKMPSAGEDAEYWIRCSFFTKFYYVDEPLVQYRVHNNNISTEAKGYADLSLFLKKVLTKFNSEKIIDNIQYKILLNNLCAMQIKMIKKFSYKSVRNLFELNPFWMFKWRNLKLLTFILIKR
ncbi:glycosyltransferase [Flavobacterium sp. UBA7680]|uniref:glycosyltransferase n=1 Tax=Flavobacterium sp. UBA7680 TaxID=1946559 RepID=UPI0025BFF564|nr:glycosyltransferase [Flavobacterium sp. UBA7680]